jgi:hypothetical protein
VAGVLVVPGVGVVMPSLPEVRGVSTMRVMIVLMMAVGMHVDTSQAASATIWEGHAGCARVARTMCAITASRPSPVTQLVNTTGRSPRTRFVSRSITSKLALT